MDKINDLLSKANVATSLLLIFFAIGAVKVLGGDLEFAQLISLLAIPTAGVAVGRGAATVELKQVSGAANAISVITILVLLYAVLGGVQVITDNLTYEAYLKVMAVPLAGIGLGRGIAANNKPR